MMPEWMAKHPCSNCDMGYGQCSQGWIHSMMCCKDCKHPTRNEGYTYAELKEMWNGKEIPEFVMKTMNKLETEEFLDGAVVVSSEPYKDWNYGRQ